MVPVTARRLSKYVEKLCGEKSPRGFSYFFRFSVKCWGGKEIRPPLILYVDPFLYTDVSVRVGACHRPKIIEICRKALQREMEMVPVTARKMSKSSAERNLCGAFLFYLYNEKKERKKQRRKSILMKL
jgi:hypothetical protein